MPLLAVSGFLAGGWDPTGGPPLLAALHAEWEGAFQWGSAVTIQQAYGRSLPFIFVALLVGLAAWHAGRSQSPAMRTTSRLVALGFILGMLGTVIDYWLGEFWNEVLWRSGFVLLTLPSLLLLLCGSSMLGLHMLQSRVSVSALALSMVLPVGILNTVAGLQYLPAAPLFPICAAWLVVFAAALTRPEPRV